MEKIVCKDGREVRRYIRERWGKEIAKKIRVKGYNSLGIYEIKHKHAIGSYVENGKRGFLFKEDYQIDEKERKFLREIEEVRFVMFED